MVPFSKFVEIYQEMVDCLKIVEQKLNVVLEYDEEFDSGVLVDFGIDDEKEFDIVYFDYRKGCNQHTVVDEGSYSKMLEINSKDELLSFLEERVIS
jgi:hypothetical protein